MDGFWRIFWPAVALTCGLLSSACGATEFDGRVFRDQDMHFRVGPVPETWRSLQVEDALLAFRDEAARSTVAVNGRCGKDSDDVPLKALTQHLFIGFTDRRVILQTALTLAKREALRTELSAELDGVPMRYLVYVLKKDGCVYDFILASPDSPSNSTLSAFERFVGGFATLPS